MKNMKKVLSTLAALSFVTVAGVSTVACNKDDKDISSMDKVFIDLELYDKNGKSQVEAELDIQDDTVSWIAKKLNDLTATNLLTIERKAKSKESFNFLTDVLKLEAKGDGDWSTKTFDSTKTDIILLTIISINPTLKTIINDYAISSGTVKIQWKENNNNIGSQYYINLKGDETKGVVKASLPTSKDLDWSNFNNEGVLKKFDNGHSKKEVPVGSDITSNLKTDTGMGKIVSAISKLIAQPLKLTVSSFEYKNNDDIWFTRGDLLKFKIRLGIMQFSTEYQLENTWKRS